MTKKEADDLIVYESMKTSPVKKNVGALDPNVGKAIAAMENGSEPNYNTGRWRINPEVKVRENIPFDPNNPNLKENGATITGTGRGQYGMMQISKDAAVEAGYPRSAPDHNLNDPSLSIKYGIEYARQMQQRCYESGERGDNLAACTYAKYHGGPGAHKNANGEWVSYEGKGDNAVNVIPRFLSKLRKIQGGEPLSEGAVRTVINEDPKGVKHAGPPCLDKYMEDIRIPYTYPPNPNHPTIYCKIGLDLFSPDGFVITPKRPQYIKYFQYTETLASGVGVPGDKWIIKIFDPTADIAETGIFRGIKNLDSTAVTTASTSDIGSEANKPTPNFLGNSNNANIYNNAIIQWGYFHVNSESIADINPDDLISEARYGRLTSYVPEFLGYGVEITLEGTSDLGIDILEKKNLMHVEDNGTPSTIKQIVKKMVDDRNKNLSDNSKWELCFEDAEPIKTHASENYTFHQFDQSDFQHLIESVLPISKSSVRDTDLPYTLQLDAANKILHCHPPVNITSNSDINRSLASFSSNPITPPVRRYLYARNREGHIRYFRPFVSPTIPSILGGQGVGVTGSNPTSGENWGKDITPEQIQKMSSHKDENITVYNIIPEDPAKHPIIYYETPHYENTAEIELENIIKLARLATLMAELQVQGDPLIRPGHLIEIIVLSYRKGSTKTSPFPHWLSGIWLVTETTHIITNGDYTTTLQLKRPNTSIEEPVIYKKDAANLPEYN